MHRVHIVLLGKQPVCKQSDRRCIGNSKLFVCTNALCNKGGKCSVVNIEEALKSSIFVVQKAATPKKGVEFCQGSNGTIRSSLATSCDVARGLRISTNQRPGNYLSHTHRHTENRHTGRPCSTSSACKNKMIQRVLDNLVDLVLGLL